MPQIPANKEYNTFVKGLITEAGPLTFPENASIDEDNFVLNTKGFRSRRLGLDYENSFSLIGMGSTVENTDSWAISTFKWEDVNTNGNQVILVVQVGYNLSFFDLSLLPISGNQLNNSNLVRLEADPKEVMQFSIVSGKLIVATSSDRVYQLSYDVVLDKVTYSSHGLLVRDFWGVSDPDSNIFRSRSIEQLITDERAYNLHNNGWGAVSPNVSNPPRLRIAYPLTYGANTGTSPTTIADAFSATADIGGLDPNLYERPADGIDSTDDDRFNGELVRRAQRGNTLAPSGSHIIDVFYRGASRSYAHEDYDILNNYKEGIASWDVVDVDGNKSMGVHTTAALGTALEGTPMNSFKDEVISLPGDSTTPRVRTTAAFAGRVFYAGFEAAVTDGDSRSPNLATHVLFSQIVTGDDKVGKCYQEGDPTSVNNFDLVDSDGGYIILQGAASILKLVPIGSSLLVFATNGVWEIGGSDVVFSATGYTVNKITDIGAVGQGSIIVANSGVFYWASNGIYALAKDDISAQYQSTNISSTTVQTLYSGIVNTAKRYCQGIFTPSDNAICWLYNDESGYDGISNRYKYTRQLNLDLNLKAFYTYSFVTDDTDALYPFVAGMLSSSDYISLDHEEQLVDAADALIVDGGIPVAVTERSITSTVTQNIYLTVKKDASLLQDTYTFGLLNNRTFTDWESDASTEQDAPAYLVTGYELLGDSQRQKQVGYITVHLQRTETGFDINLDSLNPSSCLMETRWGFADTSASNKIAAPVQVYRYRRDYVPSGSGDTFDYGFPIITTKNKVRGRGTALSIKFSTEAGKDCVLYGWGVLGYGNQNV